MWKCLDIKPPFRNKQSNSRYKESLYFDISMLKSRKLEEIDERLKENSPNTCIEPLVYVKIDDKSQNKTK